MMELKEHYENEWNANRYLFKYYHGFDAVNYDYNGLHAVCEEMKQLAIGDVFKFKPNLNMIVKGRNERFIIAATKSGKTYTVVDIVSGLCGPTDRTFEMTDFKDIESVNVLIERLSVGEHNLSYRHSVPINMVVLFSEPVN